MDNNNRGDLVISGSGSASGGLYANVKINGEGKVYGDLQCNQMKTNGASEVRGTVSSESIIVNGTVKIQGRVESGKINIHGELRSGGDLTCRDVKCHGSAHVKGRLTGELVDLEGELIVQDDCETETFAGKGAFKIGGLLNAGEIDLILYGPSRARDIGGERITVRKRGLSAMLNPFIARLVPHLDVDTIEGDEIHLENTKAKIVRGSRVTIGVGCEIDLVEYKESFTPLKGGKVHDSRQI
ncbi:bactofilin [Paenibacillus filicis]|uniref:Bactofilin n=1 Tax=Paenibacillus gyeongsangnamensis TaxID=3388067 RepID=A0ABT4QCT1_9BACL|nr:polymer-forming cytoskeletal protein [Paenibacillus filicis]MCZ8514640.1 bactofilin [Paenibacillus filicis]